MATESTLPASRALQGIRSRGLSAQLLVATAIVLTVLGVFLHRYLSDRFSADGIAVAYVTALSHRDARTAWDLVNVGDQAQLPTASNRASESGLSAQLAQPDYALAGLSDIHVSSHRSLGVAVQDTITFRHGGKPGSIDLTLTEDASSKHFLFYPTWHVALAPVALTFRAPAGSGILSVDGGPLPSGSATVAVLPGRHQVTSAASPLFKLASTPVDTGTASSGAVLLAPTLTSTGVAAAAAGLKAAFIACQVPGKSTVCPTLVAGLPIHWELVGDPTADVVYSVSSEGNLQAQGHYQMISATSNGRGDDLSHTYEAGPYTAKLQTKDGVFAVTSLTDGPASVPAAIRPSAATDDAVKASVRAAFSSCAAASIDRPVDCPQSTYTNFGIVQNLKWTLVGDPSAGATVTFEPDTGLLHALGTFSISASYDVSILGTSRHHEETNGGKFDAVVVWDAGAARVIQITATR